jgi:cell wall-associated NlpC family hydrolase
VIAFVLSSATADAQRAVDLQLGSWQIDGPNATVMSAGVGRPFWGPFAFNIRALAVVDRDTTDQSLFGLAPEISLFRGGRKLAPYGIAGLGLAVQTANTSPAALWYAGAGLEWNPNGWFGLAVEASYLVEDGGFHGCWNLQQNDRRGWVTSARLSIRVGGGSSSRSGSSGSKPPEFTPADPIPISSEPAEPLSEDASSLAYDIVDTAVGAMGEPYTWGGTSTSEGFDCSGLIYYAYAQHGVSIPRVSRDQAGAGRPVPREADRLEPGDILLFTNGGNGVDHVGLYVGNRRFIHATSSGGVKVSELETTDSYNRWWFERWVGARRVLR